MAGAAFRSTVIFRGSMNGATFAGAGMGRIRSGLRRGGIGVGLRFGGTLETAVGRLG